MRSHVLALGLVFLFTLAMVFVWGTVPQSWRNVFEDVAYYGNPTAARAFQYGERHFSSSEGNTYDVNRAKYFFDLAVAKDPTTPYLHHELARISFLRGDFSTALAHINKEIEMYKDEHANSYYVRGLIEGYVGAYDAAIADYAVYLKSDPHNWAAINDYAWVLLKAGKAREAEAATADGLAYFPDNPWLLNSNAIALYEIGELDRAREQARKAFTEASKISEEEWLNAYPGNDPRAAREGVSAFVDATRSNMHTIILASASSTLQWTQ